MTSPRQPRRSKALQTSVSDLFELQALESRLLFSANTTAITDTTALAANAISGLQSGLTEVIKLGGALDNFGALGASLAGVGQSVGTLFDFGSTDGASGFLQTKFAQPLLSQLQAGVTKASDVRTYLAGLTKPEVGGNSVTVQNVTGGYYAATNEFEWDFILGGKKSTTFALSPGSDLGAEGLTIGTEPNVTIATTVNFHLSVGMKADGTGFFITLGALDFAASADTGKSLSFNIGFNSGGTLGVANGQVKIDATLSTVTFPLVVPGAGGRITGTQLTNLEVLSPTEAAFGTVSTSLHATLPLTLGVPGLVTVLIDDANLVDATAPDVQLKYYLTDAGLRQNVLDILGSLDGKIASITNSPVFGEKIPLLDKAISDFLPPANFTTLLSFQAVAQSYFSSTTTPEVPGLIDALTTHLQSLGTLASNAISFAFDAAAKDFNVSFDLTASQSVTPNVKLPSFGDASTTLGLNLPSDVMLTVSGAAKANFTLGLDLSSATFGANTAYLKINEISASAAVAATGLNFGVSIGPLAANVVGGTINLSAKGMVGFSDPNSDGRITLGELGSTTVSLTPSGTLDVNLPLQLSFGGYDFKAAGVAPYLHLYSANPLTDSVKVDVNTPNFARLFDVGKMGPEQVLDLLIASGDWATQFRDSSVFDVKIPFLDNVDLGNAFDFGLLFSKNLRDKLSNNEAQVFSTKGAVTLAAGESFLIQMDGNEAAAKSITIPAGTYATPAALVTAFNNALTAAYNLNAPIKAVLDDGPDRKPATGDERLLLASATSDGTGFSLVGTFSDLKDLGFYQDATVATFTASTDAVVNGRISGNVSFGVSVNGGAPVTVTLNQSATTTNNSVADLAADVQSAFTAAGLSSLTVTSAGNKLVVTGNGTVKAFMMVADASPALTDLGLTEESHGGLGSIGSVLKTGPKFATFQELVPLLATALGIPEGTIAPSYDPVTETVRLHVKFGYNPAPIEVPVSFNLNLGDLASVKTVDAQGNEAPLKITLTPKLNAELDFGYSFKPAIAAESIKLAPGNGYVSPAGYVDGAATVTLADWNGRLSADAHFTVILDDARCVTLTVPQASTNGNTSVADLVADFNTAIATNSALAGKLTATLLAANATTQTAPRVQLSTVAGSSRVLEIKAADTDPARTEVGYAADSFGQVSNQGLAAINLVGQPVSYAPGADAHFTVSIDDAAPVVITLAKAATDGNTSLADLLTDLNAAIANAGLAGMLQATRFGAGDRIQFTVLGSALSLRFDTDTADAAHTKLGFSDAEIFQRLRGGEFFVENATIHAEATLAVTDLRLAAQLGFIGINVGGSGGSITLGADIALKQGTNTHFTIGSLFDAVGQGGIGSIVALTTSGSANFALNNITINAGLFTLPASPTISFVINDLFASNVSFTPTITGLPSLPNFSKLDFATIFNGVKQAVDTLANYQQFGFLNYHLPIIDVSVVDLFDYANQFKLAVEEIQNNPAGVLQLVQKTIEEALGLPPSLVTLSIDGPNLDAVKISITLQKDYSTTLGLNLDLKDLGSLFSGALASGWDALSNVIDASAHGDIQVAAYAKAQIDFGVDLTGATARPFLYDTSGVEVGVRLAGTNLNLNANIGIVGLAITGGSVIFDSDGQLDVRDKNGNLVPGGDGVIDNDFATIRMGLKDNAEPGSPNDGRHYLTENFTLADDFALTFQGQFKAVLPASIITPVGDFDLDTPIQLTTAAADFAGLIQRQPGVKPIQITLPSLKDLLPEVPGLIQLIRDPSVLLGGIDNVLYKIQQGLDSQTAAKLPLIGSRLSEGAQMIENFREGFLAELTQKLRGAGDSLLGDLQQMMFDFFGPGGSLKILKDLNGDGQVTKDDVVLTFRKADGSLWIDGTDSPKLQDAIEFNIHLGQEYIAPIPDLHLDFALPGLELKIEGSPEVKFDWNLYLGFGVSVTNLFYVDSKPTSDGLPKNATNSYVDAELNAQFNIRLTKDDAHPFTATGTLFFLQLQAQDKKLTADNQTSGGPLGYSLFNGTFQVNLNDPGVGAAQDGRITFPELFKTGGPIKVFEAGLSAKADINLGLDLSVQGSKVIPRILADFNLDWSWSFANGASPVKVGFNNVALDLGSFISDFLKPLCDQINGIIKPFDPILTALQTRIPVLSELMGRDYTLLDLAVTFGNVDRRFIDAVLQVRSLIADIAALPAGQNIIIPMGSIADFGSSLMKKGGTKNFDPVAAGISAASANLSSAPAASQNVINKSKSVSGGGFAFPILKPANVFKLLMGQDVTLFTYDIPRLEVGMSFSAQFSIFGPLVATFSGSITAYAKFAVGFDTKGLNQFKVSGDPADILDGFYVSDRANADGTGADVPEAGMVGKISIGGAVNLAVVKAGIEGFFQLSANLDLNDPNDDGKIRGSEIAALLTYKTPDGKSYGPLNLGSITLKGEVGARAYVDVFALFGYKTVWEYEFFRATIFEKTFSAPRPVPTLAQADSSGTLQLNAGDSANKRAFGSTTDVGESYTLTQMSPGVIKVVFNNTGTEQVVSGVQRVVVSAGKGDDMLDARGLTVPVTFDGGEGDDTLYAGDAGSTLIGGSGNDTIYGGKGVDIIFGGDGSDTIFGGQGDDIIDGGAGNDTIEGGEGRDTIKFSDNWGADTINLLGGSVSPNAQGAFAPLGATGGALEENRDTFDFSAATLSLNISVGTNQSKVTAGKNSVTANDSIGEIRQIIGGSGNDAVNINSSSVLGIALDGGKGADTYSIGFGRLNGLVTISDTSANLNEDDTIVVAPTVNSPISLYDAKLVLTKSTSAEQVNYTGIESLTVDAAQSPVSVEEPLTFDNNVRLKGSSLAIKNTIDGGYIRVDSGNAIQIDADLNAHASGNVEVVTSKGDIQINANVWSSANKTGGATGTGAGVIQLVSRLGQIVTDSTGTVRADDGYLLLQGGAGSIGSAAAPILTQVATLASRTTGSGVVNIHEADGLIIGDVSLVSGLSSNGGNMTVTNDANSLTFNSPASAAGGNMTFVSDQVQINAPLTSAAGVLLLEPLHTTTDIAIGDGLSKTFALSTSEIAELTDGFDSVHIGRMDGRHQVYIEDVTFTDPTYIQNPILGGHVYQTGTITGVGNASLNILGSGHTTDLDNQTIANGNINILDSARVRAGESVRLQADQGNININFDLDGAGSGTTEKLTLSAPNGMVTIKGNIGSLNVIDELVIENAQSVRFEGNVKVGKLTILNAATTFTVDGAVTADSIDLQTVGTVDFNSAVAATSITHSAGTLGVATFEGAVNAPTISLAATSLLDFYQKVDTGALTLSTTGLTGDILLRQQLTATGAVSVQSLDDVAFQGPVSAASLTIGNAHDLAFQSTLSVSGALRQTSGTGTSTFASVMTGSADLSASSLIFNSNLTATTGGLTLHADPAGNISVSGALTANAGALAVTQAGAVTFSAQVNVKSANLASAQFITVANSAAFISAGAVTLTTTDPAIGEIRLTGSFSAGGLATITTARALTFLGTFEAASGALTAASTINLGTGSVTTTNGDLRLVTTASGLGNGVTASGPVSIASAFTILTPRALALSSSLQAASVNIDAAAITLPGTVETTGGITLSAAVTGDIILGSTINAGGAFLADRGRDFTFNGLVTADSISVGATAARVITVGAAGLKATNDLTLQSTAANGSIVANSSLTSLNGVLTGSAVGAFNVSGAVKGKRVVATAGSLGFGSTLDADGTGAIKGLVLDAAVDGAGFFSFGSTVNSADAITIGSTNRPANLAFSNDLIAATGALSIRSTGDVTVSGETRASSNALSIIGSQAVTLSGAVTARTVTINVVSLTAKGTLSATAGDAVLTTTGDIAVTGATSASGSLKVTQAQNVTLSGSVGAADFTMNAASFLAGNSFATTVGNADLTTTGNIRVVGLATVAKDLIIRGAANVTFQGQALVTGKIQQIDGTATTRFEGVAQAASISVKTAQQIFSGSTFRASSGDIVLESDEIDFVGGTNTVQGTAQLVLRPYTAGTTIDLGSPTPTGTLDLSDTDLNALRAGFAQIIIGRAEDATGSMLIGSSVFKDNVTLEAGSITVENSTLVGQQVSSLGSLTFVARVGGISVNDDLDASNIVLNARDNITINAPIQGRDFVTVLAGTDASGGVTVTTLGTVEGTAAGSDVTIATGATTGDLSVAGLLAAKDKLTLTAASGSITQTAGKSIAANVLATAQNGITLLTTADHLSARVTGPGNLTITDENPSASHVLVLGSQTDTNDGLFTSNGAITVTANGNGSAYRVVANGAVSLNFGGEIFVGTVNGSPSHIVGTILLDQDRTTQGDNITFDGNVRLLRDVTLASHGGNISITGRVSGTVGSNYGLTLDAGTGNVTVGGPIGFDVLTDAPLGFLRVLSADHVTFGDAATKLAAIRVLGDLEVNSNSIAFNAPDFSVRSLNHGQLRLLPLDRAAAIDVGSPRGGTAEYALTDQDLRALGDGFSLITIGQAGGLHTVNVESAQFRDSLVLNGDVVRLLTSSTPQSVTGVSVVNGNDDNSITINARSQFTQGSRAALTAGRFGDISITADIMELDGLSANLIRGFGNLTLQPFSPTQAITLGAAGTATDFDLTVGELATLADGFRLITIGRADGEHAITAAASLTFRDSVAIQAPLGAGSITLGNAAAPTKVRTTAKGDTLTLRAGGNVTIDSSLATVGAGALTVIADADSSGAGDLLIGQNLGTKNLTLAFNTEQGAQILRGENILISAAVPATAKFGAVLLTSKTGNITLTSNLDHDSDGSVIIRNAKTAVTTGGTVSTGATTASILVESAHLTGLASVALQALGTIDLITKAGVASNLFVKLTAGGNLSVLSGAVISATSGSFELRADRDDATDDGNLGLLTLGAGTSVTAKTAGLLSAFQVQRDPKATVKASHLTLDQG